MRLFVLWTFLALAAAFCAFGFLATFEPGDARTILVWRAVYGVGFALALFGGWRLWRDSRRAV